jgi:hypothetical protein
VLKCALCSYHQEGPDLDSCLLCTQGHTRSCGTPRWSELSMSTCRSEDKNIRQDPEPEDFFVSEGASSSVFPSAGPFSGNFFLRCMECLGGQV